MIFCYQITDFGLSKIRATSSIRTTRQGSGSWTGTIPYIPPERFSSQNVDMPLHVQAKWDVYR